MKHKIYLDNASTTQVSPEVLETMKTAYGNSCEKGEAIVKGAERILLDALNTNSGCVYFTSSGTQANNIVIKAFAEKMRHYGRHLLVSSIEHPSVGNVYKALSREGYHVTEIPVNAFGIIDLDGFRNVLTDETILVSVMYFNNEIGSRQPVEAIENILREHQALFHVDAIQALGKTKLKPIGDAMTFSAHKINGPKGVGAIYAKDSIGMLDACPQTQNSQGIAGFAKAIELSGVDFERTNKRLIRLKNLLKNGLLDLDASLSIVGEDDKGHPGILNVHFPNRDGDALVIRYDMEGVCLSTGAACSSGAVTASHVLLAMGMKTNDAKRCLRFSIGKNNTEEEIFATIEATKKILRG